MLTTLPLCHFTFVKKLHPSARHDESRESGAVQLTKGQFYTIFILFGSFLTVYVGAETGFGGWFGVV